ncbi:citrate synthase [Aspergillus ibericus CBS 121593]|uniref:Citrate synthase n=1 Tax=Aspergillus ibericus CBS 121593 TaxID=1448316 RepID=A0A395H5D4_9EURO|nr:citrate synthase [Aspergillus ibericus CBS 121593]RAL03097.1 citrate synthase [Aspergillus ibericus CBS 121593]
MTTNGTNGTNGVHETPAPSLHVVDSRTGQYYEIPIVHNAIHASEFKRIKAPVNQDYYPDQTENGIRVFDPGFSNTAVKESKITYIDGTKGIIQYRGYSIDDIISQGKSFIDTVHLLVWGHWPSPIEAKKLQIRIADAMTLDGSVYQVIRSFPPSGSIMGMIIAGLSALQSTQMDTVPAHAAKNLYLGNPDAVDEQIITVLAALPMISAIAYCHHLNRPFTPPRRDLSYIENLFLMTGHVDPKTSLPNPRYVGYFERLWVLIADHEMTCSTAAMLQTASSLPDAISCLISAISAMYGPLHGGAIEVAYRDIAAIGSVDACKDKIERVKSGKERLYGYGHRVYRVTDPRAVHIQAVLSELQEEIAQDPLLKVAFELNRLAADDEYFVKRKLKPNADLFAAFTYGAMGFPEEFILPISIVSRTQGFLAHWKEAMGGTARIWRPGQVYVGEVDRKF